MRLIDLHIEGFGKFHDLDLRFAEGMNILYGHNEAGKSTLHAFLQAMLYGLERRPGIGSAAKLHKKYRPWDAPERFGGTLRLAHEGRIYRIVRDFNADDLSADGAATATASTIDTGLSQMKNIATQPRNNVVSHQCMTSTFANVRPLISVVTPFTSSWCAWWLYDRSNGDLRSLMVSTNMSARNAGMHTTIIGRSMFATPATSKVPRAKNMHTATKSTVGS